MPFRVALVILVSQQNPLRRSESLDRSTFNFIMAPVMLPNHRSELVHI